MIDTRPTIASKSWLTGGPAPSLAPAPAPETPPETEPARDRVDAPDLAPASAVVAPKRIRMRLVYTRLATREVTYSPWLHPTTIGSWPASERDRLGSRWSVTVESKEIP